jgi:site-specific DNA-methyltransferase (adenine-specific)
MSIELLNIDCMEYMAGLPDKAFDLAIVDPPYGIGAGGIGFKNGSSKSEKNYFKAHDWDLVKPDQAYFDELKRVSKNQIIWGGNYFLDHLPSTRCFIVWDKTIHGNSYADCELAWTSFDQVVRYFRENIAQTNSEGRIHPTQKSIKLYEWVISHYAKHGQRILDTHLGSGSSAIAAHNLGFEFVGCELDKDYFEAAQARFSKHKAQARMFGDAEPTVAPEVKQEVLL